MTKQQLSAATKIATSNETLLNEDIGFFDGFGLPDFKPVTCTVRQLAALVRWQCVQLNGVLDGDAMQAIAYYGKTRFEVL